MPDLLQDYGPVFLGSRLKRLGERMQAGAARILLDAGLPMQPAQMPLLTALSSGPMTVSELVQSVGISQPGVTRAIGQLVDLGLVRTDPASDLRQKSVSLTPEGAAAVARARLYVWPRVEAAVNALCGDGAGTFFQQIRHVESELSATPLDVIARNVSPEMLRIRQYSGELADHFHDINVEWISSMFRLEPVDREVLENPWAIIEDGGDILFVEAVGLGIIGTCALKKTGSSGFELTKMGVLETARGLKAGEFLLLAVVERAMQLGADPLFLLTNSNCAAAIHLYEKVGFQHDPEIMKQYGGSYARCDVAMRYRPRSS